MTRRMEPLEICQHVELVVSGLCLIIDMLVEIAPEASEALKQGIIAGHLAAAELIHNNRAVLAREGVGHAHES